jgi:N6-adenosine-specific RNA methylase IME4
MADTTGLILYETARAALAECVRVDEVKQIKSRAEQLRFYGKQIKNRGMIADAQIIVLRAERRIGQLVSEAKAAGLISKGGRPKSNLESERSSREEARDSLGPDFTMASDAEEKTDTEQASVSDQPFTLAEAGIDAKLSAQAQKWAKLGEPEFEAHLAQVRIDIESGGAKKTAGARAADTASKKADRAARERELGARQAALPEAKFGVIYADPEWQFETFSEAGMDRSADNHYPTSPLEAIKARDVGSLAATDAVLFLWATVPMLPQALEVMAAWGFEYKSNFAWVKDRAGTGYWNRNRHELLLVGTRGKIPAPAMGEQFDSVIEAAVGAHSAKPAEAYAVIEAYYPTLPKIELNARTAREGWVRWGYEAPADQHDAEQREGEAALTLGFGLTPAEVIGAVTEGLSAGLAGSGVEHQVAGAVGQILEQVLAPALGHDMAEAGNAAINEIIRTGYARNDALGAIAAATGLSENAVQKRAKRMGLSDPVRQREAVAESNRRRAMDRVDALDTQRVPQ